MTGAPSRGRHDGHGMPSLRPDETGSPSARHYAEVLDSLGRVFAVDDLTDGNALSVRLADAVAAYVSARRAEGAHAEHVIAEVKAMREALMARVRMNGRAARVADQLTKVLVEWSIAAYFDE